MNSISSCARAVMRSSSARIEGRRNALAKKLALVWLWQPTLTLSITVILSNRATFWNVRPSPMTGISWRLELRIERPSNRMSPLLGWYNRLRQLNSVVLPAPLGPIRPAIWPGKTSKLTPSSATMPPKRTETS